MYKTVRKNILVLLLVFSMMILANVSYAADAWPTKAITVLAPYAAGDWTDICLRAIVDKMSVTLGQPMAVANVVGADGATCFTQLLNAKPDGYTIGNAQYSSLSIGPWLADLPYTLESFDYIGTFGAYSHAVAVNEKSGIKDLDGLMEYARKNGRITVGYSGFINAINALNLFAAGKFDKNLVTLVTINTGLPQSLAGGHVDVAVWSQSGLSPAHEAGQIRIIAALGDTRWTAHPEIATSVEQGYNVYSTGHQGICLPKGVPDDIKAKITDAYEKALADPEFQDFMKNMKVETNIILRGQEFFESLVDLRTRSKILLDELGLSVNK